MKLAARLGIAGAIVTGIGSTLAILANGANGQDQRNATIRWESSKQCQECHADVYAEWLGSHHQIAYTNPEVRVLADDFKKEECIDCHLPRPLAVTGFGRRTLPRLTHFDEGVSCITCHLAADGGILGAKDRPEAPCRPRQSDEFLSVDACMSCHNQHGTTDQWRASHFAQQGTDCSTCHMPHVERTRPDGSTRMGRGHRWLGAHDKATLASAGKFTVERRAGEVVLALENVGAGHNYPTEERHRAVDMMYRFVTPDAEPGEWTRAWRFRQPYRDEPGENTQLPAGERKEVAVPVPSGAVAVEARLWYRLTPFCGDEDPRSTLLEERRVDLH